MPPPMFSKVLVANRGEIAVRVIRALDELGIASVAVYSEADRDAQHVKRAGEAYLLGPGPAAESYLKVDKLLEVDRGVRRRGRPPRLRLPGRERRLRHARWRRTGITFIGPPAERDRGDGLEDPRPRADAGRRRADRARAPPRRSRRSRTPQKIAEEIGYPIAVKAAGGGGGKGFRVALEPDKLQEAFEGAAREGEKFFSDDTVYLERYLPDPRHVEVQVLADKQGNTIHLGERDCSIQRRHQKLIEESPAPLVDDELREQIGKIAVDAAKAVGYHSAGTIEGLLQDGEYFFLEMNTRVQVEHCVTEEVSGIDIVREQILIAAGETLSITQDDVDLRGHAIECRINAEDAAKNFAPAPGTDRRTTASRAGPGVRVDSGVLAGSRDHAAVRPDGGQADRLGRRPRAAPPRGCCARSTEFEIEGVTTLIPFHKAIMASEQWAKGETCRDLIEDRKWLKDARAAEAAAKPDEDEPEPVERTYTVEVSGKRFEVTVHGEPMLAPANGAAPAQARKPARAERAKSGGGGGADELTSPLQGNMWKVLVEKGATVEEGQLICIIEAMKMENEITAHKAGTIEDLPITEGAAVKSGDLLAVIK